MYSGWVGDDDSTFVGLRACAHKVRCFLRWWWGYGVCVLLCSAAEYLDALLL
jgi:hypothetical protein